MIAHYIPTPAEVAADPGYLARFAAACARPERRSDVLTVLVPAERLEDAPAPGTTVAAAVSMIRERGWALVRQEPIGGGVLDVWQPRTGRPRMERPRC